MSKQEEPFLPERVDEQIEALDTMQVDTTPAYPNARLIEQLYQMYSDDSEVVEHVWTRLTQRIADMHEARAEQNDRANRHFQSIQVAQQKGPQSMTTISTKKRQKNIGIRFLETLVAVLVLAIIVGGMAVMFTARHEQSKSSTSSTKTASPSVPDQTGLYVATQTGVSRMNLKTGKTDWHITSAYPGQPLVMDGTVFFKDATGPVTYLRAATTANGKDLWRKNYGSSTFLLGANSTLYDSTCVTTNTKTGKTDCYIDAIKASTGELLWQYPTPKGTSWITLQDGVLYGVSYSQFFALNATTGHPLWEKTLSQYTDQDATQTPVVYNNILYFPSCNSHKYTTTTTIYKGCYLFAVNASNGAQVWQPKQVNSSFISSPVIADGVVYYASFEGDLYALNAQNGAVLWTQKAAAEATYPVLAAQGILYTHQIAKSGDTATLTAIKIANRSVVWSQQLNANAWFITPVLDNGLLYFASENTVEVLNASNGHQVQSYTSTDGTITNFTVVTPE